MEEAARLHWQQLSAQGFHVSLDAHRPPVDFSAHVLLPHPFGRDSRYEQLSSSDEPEYSERASLYRMDSSAHGSSPRPRGANSRRPAAIREIGPIAREYQQRMASDPKFRARMRNDPKLFSKMIDEMVEKMVFKEQLTQGGA